jgi:hypothetical protein
VASDLEKILRKHWVGFLAEGNIVGYANLVFSLTYCIAAAEREQNRLYCKGGREEVSWPRISLLEIHHLSTGSIRKV